MYDLGPDDVVVNGFPLFHVAGAFVYGLSVLYAGGTLVVPTRLACATGILSTRSWRHVAEHRVTVIGGVPTVVSALNSVAVDADIMLVMLTGGSPLPTDSPMPSSVAHWARAPQHPRNDGMRRRSNDRTVSSGPRTPGSTGLRLPFTELKVFRSSGSIEDSALACDAGEKQASSHCAARTSVPDTASWPAVMPGPSSGARPSGESPWSYRCRGPTVHHRQGRRTSSSGIT